ncbi:hypothetical protein AB0P21_20500 [Kribbella sp. NPDC056861]|uniref:hypothetical protein n=1 Tax=Kribbella sp. NPDC056861 TaxID=3154857 RepID=UPI00342912BE
MTYRFTACVAGADVDPDGGLTEAGPVEDVTRFREVLTQILAYVRADARQLRVAL